MTVPQEPPGPPYIVLFEDTAPDALPLAITVGERRAVPLFDSGETARSFLASTDFGSGWEPVEISGRRLLQTLESLRGQVEYVAINPPPAKRGGIKVRMGGLEELIEALRQGGEPGLLDFLEENGPGSAR